MADSLTLSLYHAARGYQDRVTRRLSEVLARAHGIALSPAQLGFLAALICGETTTSEVARRTGVSRQAAHRQAAALAELGYLALTPDPARRNQSIVTFTGTGVRLMALCREILAGWDRALGEEAETLARAAAIMATALTEGDG
ncbi:MarR family transcriptional regulator [Roseovarius ramblicola]|uniref:MarR family transcriptional regulator n=1 Tax=Roseovarius ramblicola TaxID=2022336 RepID=A0ABV5HUZ7_9RHOB